MKESDMRLWDRFKVRRTKQGGLGRCGLEKVEGQEGVRIASDDDEVTRITL